MLTRNPLRPRTLWVSLSYFETHFMPVGLYLTSFMFLAFKLTNGLEFTPAETMIIRIETLLTTVFLLQYFIVIRKSARVFFGQKEAVPWALFFEQVVVGKIILLFFLVIPQFIATVLLAAKTPRYEAAVKWNGEGGKAKAK